ncbi:MAG TPA: acetoin utilization protein AcuC [Sedimenticola sp.]|nr:acetoin utilization protein AcuC [Sedimenticola sp.]
MTISLYAGETLARYGFGNDHPFGPDRYHAFMQAFREQKLAERVAVRAPASASRADLLLFHTPEYVDRVERLSRAGGGMLDPDTPAFPGLYEAALTVVGSVLAASDRVMSGPGEAAFVPIAGLHHARREGSAGFCVFNDCAIAIEHLRQRHGIRRIAYVDIDAHHGDGVFYAYESDPDLIFADIHEDGHFLYPGTGALNETGRGAATGRKLNIPAPPGADDDFFLGVWPRLESFIARSHPEFIILQCGADSVAGDPLTQMAFSTRAHHHAALQLTRLAGEQCDGRLLALGGGGYNRANLAQAWTAVIEGMLEGQAPAGA